MEKEMINKMTKEEALRNYIYNSCLSWEEEVDGPEVFQDYVKGEHSLSRTVDGLILEGKTAEEIHSELEKIKKELVLLPLSDVSEGKYDMANACINIINEMIYNKNFYEEWAEEIKEGNK